VAQGSRFEYRPVGHTFRARPGTLTHFLVERYVLFAQTPRGIARGRVHHMPYTVSSAEVPVRDDHLFPLNRLPAPGRPPDHVLYSPGVDVDVYRLERDAGQQPN
jgi:hypothetical protein